MKIEIFVNLDKTDAQEYEWWQREDQFELFWPWIFHCQEIKKLANLLNLVWQIFLYEL